MKKIRCKFTKFFAKYDHKLNESGNLINQLTNK